MKKLIPTVFLLLTATMLTGCVAANSGDSAPAPTQDAAIETVAEKTKPADVAATTTEPAEQEPAVDEANTAEGTDEAAGQPVEDTMTFIVDITDNLIAESGKVIGNTTTIRASSKSIWTLRCLKKPGQIFRQAKPISFP